jgi:hypothetical protein
VAIYDNYQEFRIRDRGRRTWQRLQSFIAPVMKAAAKANGGPLTLVQMRGEGWRGGVGNRPRKGRCCRIGRSQAAADHLKHSAERRGPSGRMRRVVVKERIVRLKRGGKVADAHLRYLQRDGTTREGERGRLYGPQTDAVDGKELVERGREDRHQFRFIVAPKDGDRLSDLRAFSRDAMLQMAQDLGTKLDWVAVDHVNTGHPNSHIVIRGKDESGKDLVIAQDYVTDGVRLRARVLQSAISLYSHAGRATIIRAHIAAWPRPPASAFWAATTSPISKATSAGWRPCAGRELSSGSRPIIGVFPMILRTAQSIAAPSVEGG